MDLGDDARGYLYISAECVVTEAQSPPLMFLEAFEILKDSHQLELRGNVPA